MYESRLALLSLSAFNDVQAGLTEFKTTEVLSDKTSAELSKIFFTLLGEVYSEIRDGEVVRLSLLPYKSDLISVILLFDLQESRADKLCSIIFDKVENNIPRAQTEDIELLRKLEEYRKLFSEAILNYVEKLLRSDVTDLLKTVEYYQYSKNEIKVNYIDFDSSTRKIYTLFPQNRYFDTWRKLNSDETFSPLDFNNRLSSGGLQDFRLKFTYDDTVIYNNKLYKLKATIENPTKDSFVEEEWSEYTSRVLDPNLTFGKVYNNNLLAFYNQAVEKSFDVNSIISDSSYSDISPIKNVSERTLNNSWGGDGRKVFEAFKQLQGVSTLFGGYEGSVAGAIDFSTLYLEYFFASALGKKAKYVFSYENNSSIFGEFSKIFAAKTTLNKIPGLSFLEKLAQTKSFSHNRVVHPTNVVSTAFVSYNPVYSAYREGLEDDFVKLDITTTYEDSRNTDLLFYSVNALYSKFITLGDLVEGIRNSLDSKGRVRGFEGLGDVTWQLDIISNNFPSSRVLKEKQDFLSGISGAIRYFLESYTKFSTVMPNPVLSDKALKILSGWVDALFNSYEVCYNTIYDIFLGTKEYIPNISFKEVEPLEYSKLRSFLNNAGLRESEVNRILSVGSFKELIEIFAPISDSQDLRSFFKAYELTQLLYEFGSQEAVDTYLKFLFTGNELEQLLNILSINTKNPSQVTKYQENKYPKLIGLLIGLTYAIDPEELKKFQIILGNNSLDLLDSINYLLSTGQQNIIKSPESIDVLTPLATHLLQPYFDDADLTQSASYDQVKKYSPIQLDELIKTIEQNSGNIKNKEILVNLLNKTVGMTPKELIYVLNFNKDSLTPLSEILDGFSGGRLTSLLKYANLAGLTQKLSSFQSSYQVNNFKVESSKYSLMFSFLEELQKTLEIFKITKNTFKDYFEFSADRLAEQTELYNSIFNTQNKTVSAIAEVLLDPTSDVNSNIDLIVPSPGIGNSPVPNRTQVVNSVTPEQAVFLSSQAAPLTLNAASLSSQVRLIEKFIKIKENNPLKDNPKDESLGIFSPDMSARLKSKDAQAKEYISTGEKSRPDLVYDIQPIDLYKSGNPVIKSSASLGANYLEPEYKYLEEVVDRLNGLISPFDPVESCVRFGGNRSDCEEAYKNGRCGSPISKALVAETYEVIPGQDPSKIYVDRPLGTFAQYKPRGFILPTQNKGPVFYSYLNKIGFTVSQTERGEPLLGGRNAYPEAIIPDKESTILSEYINSEFGLREYISIGVEKDKELSCVSLKDPYKLQACMNMLKCKKFAPPYEGKYYLGFCPRGSAGGRLR